MPHLGNKAVQHHLCGSCADECQEWEGVFCDSCENWFHTKCEQMEIQVIQMFRELPETPYLCRTCRCEENSYHFNFDTSLCRLYKGAKQGIEKLFMYVERERLFLKEDMTFNIPRTPKYTSDVQAQALLQEYCPLEKKQTAKVSPDNNSLFSAVSLALVGNEKLNTELRVRCCIEMVVFDSFYRWQKNYENLAKCAPDYTESCLNCATPTEESCVWTMSALASVIRRPVESIYPSVNGKADRAILALNTKFLPRGKVTSDEAVKIFWSCSKNACLEPGSWIPDSFVPLVDFPVVPLSPMVSPRVSSRKRKPTAKIMAFTNSREKNQLQVLVQHEEPLEQESDYGDSGAEQEMPPSFSMEPVEQKEDFLDRFTKEEIDLNWMNNYSSDVVGGKPLKGTSFLSAQEVFVEATTSPGMYPAIPPGRKEDVFFVVDNSKNMKYRHRRNHFHDDCGKYNKKSTTTCKSYYLLATPGRLQPLIKSNDLYCKESKRVSLSGDVPNRKRFRIRSRGRGRGTAAEEGEDMKDDRFTKWIPMDPQPPPEKIITLHRYYCVLEKDPTYKRRISWFVNLPEFIRNGRDVFVVEYLTKPVSGLALPASRKLYTKQGGKALAAGALNVDLTNDSIPEEESQDESIEEFVRKASEGIGQETGKENESGLDSQNSSSQDARSPNIKKRAADELEEESSSEKRFKPDCDGSVSAAEAASQASFESLPDA